jgi:hypothetical protein
LARAFDTTWSTSGEALADALRDGVREVAIGNASDVVLAKRVSRDDHGFPAERMY